MHLGFLVRTGASRGVTMRRRCEEVSRVILCGALMLGALATSAGAGTPKPGRWVAADAVIYVELEQPRPLVERLTGPAAAQMLGSIPSYNKALEGKEYLQFKAVVDLVSAQLGVSWQEAVRELTGGGLALAVEGGMKDGKAEARIALFVVPTDPALLERAHGILLDMARKDAKANDRPDPVKEVDYRGVKAYAVNDDEAHAILDGMLVVTNGGEALKAIVDRSIDGMTGEPFIESAAWKERKAGLETDATARGIVRLERLRELDPKRYRVPDQVDPGAVLLFGPWIETLRQAPWMAASLTWTDERLGAQLQMPTPADGLSPALKTYVPGSGEGAPAPLRPPGTIASFSLWRDLAAIWEVRSELFPAPFVEGLAQLDTFAGQFFGGRDFGTGVLGALTSDWRIVVARQDFDAIKPTPDLKLPAFALVVGLSPDDDDFAQRLRVAFQSFVGLANLGAAQAKAPPLELGSETFEGRSIATARFMPAKDGPPADEPVHYRHNFSPSAVEVADHYVISSSVGLARELIRELSKGGAGDAGPETLEAEADGRELAALVDANRERLVMQNMLEKGNDKAKSEEEVDVLATLLRTLGSGRLTVVDGGPRWEARLNFQLGSSTK